MSFDIKDINKDSFKSLLNFLCATRYLKHAQGQQDSLAEHYWQTAIMVIAITPHLDIRIDLKQALKMSLLQDLYPWVKTSRANKANMAKYNLQQACLNLDGIFGLHLYELSEEYHQQITYEAKLVKAISDICHLLPAYPVPVKKPKPMKAEMLHHEEIFDQGLSSWKSYIIQSLELAQKTKEPAVAEEYES